MRGPKRKYHANRARGLPLAPLECGC